MGVFHPSSSAKNILEDTGAGKVCTLEDSTQAVYKTLDNLLKSIQSNTYSIDTDWSIFEKYSAKEMTKRQVELFNMIVN